MNLSDPIKLCIFALAVTALTCFLIFGGVFFDLWKVSKEVAACPLCTKAEKIKMTAASGTGEWAGDLVVYDEWDLKTYRTPAYPGEWGDDWHVNGVKVEIGQYLYVVSENMLMAVGKRKTPTP